MKRIGLVLAITCSMAIVSISALITKRDSHDSPDAKHVFTTTPNGAHVNFVANSVDKNWVTSIMHLEGAVRVEISPGRKPKSTIILRADAVDYHEDTGEFSPSGNVRLTVEDVK